MKTISICYYASNRVCDLIGKPCNYSTIPLDCDFCLVILHSAVHVTKMKFFYDFVLSVNCSLVNLRLVWFYFVV